MDEQMTQVEGLPRLLRSVAERIESDIDGLNPARREARIRYKELLVQSAAKLDQLEAIAAAASKIVESVPRAGDGSLSSKVKRELLVALSIALLDAGKNVAVLRV
jgi:hypothetical protein